MKIEMRLLCDQVEKDARSDTEEEDIGTESESDLCAVNGLAGGDHSASSRSN